MPYKDLEERSAYLREYSKRDYVKDKKRQYQQEYSKTPRYKYTHARKGAIRRGIPWEFTFEEWLEVWQKSGHWEERNPIGYVMCRYGDEGPYSKDNVYIATHTQNKKDAWENGKTSHPPIGAKKGKVYISLEEQREKRLAYAREYQRKRREALRGQT